jgi:cytochrome c556
MKMKKLLSIGALGLVLACSISVGASAATIPSNADLIKIVVNQYKNGTNPVGVLSGVNKDTKLGDVVSDDVLDEADSQLSNHQSVDKLATKIENNKENTIATVLNKVTADATTFSNFQSKFIEIAEKVQAMDAKVGADRIASEQKIVDIVKAYDDSFDVTFGKDNQGKTTASIEKDGHVLVQLNSDNLQTIIDRVRNLTWAEVSAAKALL